MLSCLVSCRPGFYRYRPGTTHPTVILIDGQEVKTKKVILKGRKIITDLGKIKKRDITTYSDSFKYFTRVTPYRFGERVIQGKINVYEWSHTYSGSSAYSGGSYHSYPGGTTTRYYIQNGDTGKIYRMRYPFLKKMIPKTAPEYPMTMKFWRTRNLSGWGAFTGVVLTTGGILYTIKNSNPGTRPSYGAAVSTTLISSGTILMTTSFIINARNHRRMSRIIERYDNL